MEMNYLCVLSGFGIGLLVCFWFIWESIKEKFTRIECMINLLDENVTFVRLEINREVNSNNHSSR